jgi:hypothetical protein
MTSTASKITIIIAYKTDVTEAINPTQTVSTTIAWQTFNQFSTFPKEMSLQQSHSVIRK